MKIYEAYKENKKYMYEMDRLLKEVRYVNNKIYLLTNDFNYVVNCLNPLIDHVEDILLTKEQTPKELKYYSNTKLRISPKGMKVIPNYTEKVHSYGSYNYNINVFETKDLESLIGSRINKDKQSVLFNIKKVVMEYDNFISNDDKGNTKKLISKNIKVEINGDIDLNKETENHYGDLTITKLDDFIQVEPYYDEAMDLINKVLELNKANLRRSEDLLEEAKKMAGQYYVSKKIKDSMSG